MDIVELLQREIQEHKMAWSKLKEENVVLRGFKAIVMKDPKKYAKSGTCVTAEMKKDRIGHNGPPESIFDEEREKFRKEHKLRQEAEGELTIIKGIGNTSPEMKALKEEIKNLKWIKDHDYIFLVDENKKLHAELKKLKEAAEGEINKMRKSGL